MTAHLTNGEKLKHFGPKRKKWRRRTHSCLCLSIKGGEWICVTNWIVILLGSLRHQLKLNQSAAPNKSRPEFLQNHFIPTMIKAPETIWTCHMAYAFCMLEALVWTRINEPTTYDIYASAVNIPRQQIGRPATCSHIAVLKHFTIALTISALNSNTKYLCFNT